MRHTEMDLSKVAKMAFNLVENFHEDIPKDPEEIKQIFRTTDPTMNGMMELSEAFSEGLSPVDIVARFEREAGGELSVDGRSTLVRILRIAEEEIMKSCPREWGEPGAGLFGTPDDDLEVEILDDFDPKAEKEKEEEIPRIRGVVEKRAAVFYDSILFDGKDQGRESHRLCDRMVLFSQPYVGDNERTNFQGCGGFPGDQTFRITKAGMHVSFSDPDLYREFFRGGSIELFVGQKSYLEIPAAYFSMFPNEDREVSGYRGIECGECPYGEEVPGCLGNVLRCRIGEGSRKPGDKCSKGLRGSFGAARDGIPQETYSGGYCGWFNLAQSIPILARQNFFWQVSLPKGFVDRGNELLRRGDKDLFIKIQVMMDGIHSREIL